MDSKPTFYPLICLIDQENIGFDLDYAGLAELGRLQVFPVVANDQLSTFLSEHRPPIVVANRPLFSRPVLAAGQAAGLRLVALTATGTNTVDLPAAAELGIKVCNIRGYSTNSVAQHTLALALALRHRLTELGDFVRGRTWVGRPVFSHLSPVFSELAGQTWGIIGLGTIGRRVAELALALGCRVIFASSNDPDCHQPRDEAYRQVSLAELLVTSDVVLMHAGVSATNVGLIGYAQLSLMKPSAILLNLGRGALINEADLARALAENKLAGAGLDVLWPEPPAADNPLLPWLETGRLLITPHIAWAARESRQRAIAETVLNIEAFLAGQDRNLVN